MFKNNGSARILIFALIGFIFLNACLKEDSRIEEERIKLRQYLEDNGYGSLVPTNSGLYYVVLEEGAGTRPVESDFVNINFTSSLIDGTVFETSNATIAYINNILRNDKLYGPAKFQLSNLGIAGLKEGIMLMNGGGISKIIIPSSLGFGPEYFGFVPPYSTLIYDVALLDVISNPAEHEQKLIENYLDKNEITATPTSSGLYYIEKEEGTGDPPGDYSNIVFHYKEFLIDGRLLRWSEVGTPATINLILNKPVPGFSEGMKMMRSGGKATLIVPWFLGYGEEGSTDERIPPYSTLVYELEVVSIQ
jgi:FKBP-type peptidyl-prolyl cis-trans isomerase FkpA